MYSVEFSVAQIMFNTNKLHKVRSNIDMLLPVIYSSFRSYENGVQSVCQLITNKSGSVVKTICIYFNENRKLDHVFWFQILIY